MSINIYIYKYNSFNKSGSLSGANVSNTAKTKARSHKASRRCGCSSATKDAGSHGSPMESKVEAGSDGRYNGSQESTLDTQNHRKQPKIF